MTTKKVITTEQALKEGNSSVNQGIKQKFVDMHVNCNVNSLVEYCLSKGFEDSDSPVNIDSIENYYSYPEYNGEYARFEGGTEDERSNEIERLKGMLENEHFLSSQYETIEGEIEELERLETEPSEIYEWWAISSHLFNKLRDMGYTVVDAGSCYIWGRTTTGQAILLDYCITKVCAEMGILNGQENSWV